MISSRHRRRLRQHARLLAVCLVCLVAIPMEALASLDIVPGQSATVSDTGGDPINLRAKPRTDSLVLGSVSEGDLVDVIEGPMQDTEGMWWYKVVAGGTRAYIAADFLSLNGGSSNGNPVGVVTGTATITNTGGDPINCRSGAGAEYGIIGAFNEGDSVELTGERSGPWQPVNCGGQGGYVHTDFISYGTSSGGSEPTATRATIVNTGGDPINCRSRASTNSTVLTVFSEGDRVTLTGPLVNSWQPVTCAGTNGFVHKDYLSKTISGDSGGDSGGTVTGTGVIANTNGDGLNCRAQASFSGAVITVLTEGTQVQLRGSAASNWQPIVCAGQNGYVSADYIDVSDTPNPTPTDPAPNTDLRAGDDAVVANTNGDGVRLRSQASSTSAIITVLAEGAQVVVRTGSTGDWVAVTYRTSNGFVHKDYLAKVTAPDPTPTPEPGSGLKPNDHALLTDDMNFRSSPSFNGAVQTVLPKGTVVLVTGAVQSGFYPVSAGGFSGYLHGDYLSWTDKALTDNSDGVGGDPGNEPITPQGQKMIDYAMKFLGYPYVWATHGPDTFDCSGFTYYVTIKTLKMDIGAGTWSQSIAGRPVAYGDLRPGDLVFFQNTYTWGLSHVGIYIGNGKFIHAENEQTGVVISSLTSTYYKTRWYGARRLTTD